jgi:hypothetical protein
MIAKPIANSPFDPIHKQPARLAATRLNEWLCVTIHRVDYSDHFPFKSASIVAAAMGWYVGLAFS